VEAQPSAYKAGALLVLLFVEMTSLLEHIAGCMLPIYEQYRNIIRHLTAIKPLLVNTTAITVYYRDAIDLALGTKRAEGATVSRKTDFYSAVRKLSAGKRKNPVKVK
jgi:hypothetical protein